MILLRLLQPLNVELSIVVRLFGKVTFVKLVQFSNAFGPIFVILAGIEITDSPVHPLKAEQVFDYYFTYISLPQM